MFSLNGNITDFYEISAFLVSIRETKIVLKKPQTQTYEWQCALGDHSEKNKNTDTPKSEPEVFDLKISCQRNMYLLQNSQLMYFILFITWLINT